MATELPDVPNPNVAIVGEKTTRPTIDYFRFFTRLVNALANRLPITGSATFAAATTATVTFSTPEKDANYDVWFSPPDSKTYWASSKTANGFTANASSSVSATVRWQLIRA